MGGQGGEGGEQGEMKGVERWREGRAGQQWTAQERERENLIGRDPPLPLKLRIPMGRKKKGEGGRTCRVEWPDRRECKEPIGRP